MVSKRRLVNLLTIFIFVGLLVVACERPLTNDGADQTGDGTDQTGQTDDPNAGGGTDGTGDTGAGETGDGTAVTDDTTGDTTTDGTGDAGAGSGDGTQDDSGEAGGAAGDTGDDTGTTDTGDDGQTAGDDAASDAGAGDAAAGDTSADDSAAGDTTGDAAADTTTDGTIPATHTVAAGENLYRIGLKYGISWVAIANENNLANPNVLSIGQVLKLPGATPPRTDPPPTPSPQTETTYIVKQGDNLYRIGLQFGISWIQIAEANGLVNPNLIKVGDELKIPVNTPGPAPQFTHVVKQGETLFLISLQYGVAWPSIAEANNLSSPYIIYVGQTLEIPGSQ